MVIDLYRLRGIRNDISRRRVRRKMLRKNLRKGVERRVWEGARLRVKKQNRDIK